MANDRHMPVNGPKHPARGKHRKITPPLPAFQSLPANADDTDNLEEILARENSDVKRQGSGSTIPVNETNQRPWLPADNDAFMGIGAAETDVHDSITIAVDPSDHDTPLDQQQHRQYSSYEDLGERQ